MALVLAAGAIACAAPPVAEGGHPKRDADSAASADTCPGPRTPADGVGSAYFKEDPAGSWTEVRTYTTTGWSIIVPAVAVVTPGASEASAGVGIRPFPVCRLCNISVSVEPDEGGGPKAVVAKILANEARIDSLNHTRGAIDGYEFNEYHGPARVLVRGGDSAIYLRGDCGDCRSGHYFFGDGKRIAHVTYEADNARNAEQRACELERVALTFRWRR
jgi:hypothetical protein